MQMRDVWILYHKKKLSSQYQGRHGWQDRQDRQDRGLAWILKNRMRREQRGRAGDVASTVAVLPVKNLPWRP